MPYGKVHAWIHGFPAKPARDGLTLGVFDSTMKLSKDSPFQVISSVDYIPRGRLDSIPSADTACPRDTAGFRVGGIYIVWDDPKPKLETEAKNIAEKISRIAGASGVSFGNFSKCFNLPVGR